MSSLFQQMHRSIDVAFKPGMSKHAATEEMRSAVVVSYRHEKNLNDLARDLSNYLKEAHPELKLVRDVKAEHVSEYLAEKKREGCSDNYIKTLRSQAAKIGDLASNLYRTDIDWGKGVKAPENALKQAKNGEEDMKDINTITPAQYEELKERIEGKRGQSKDAILIAGAFGLRVSELTKLTPKDIEEEGKLHIHRSKGGRSRDLEVRTQEQAEAIERLKKLSEGKAELQRIFTIENDSINKFYRENAQAVGIEKAEQYGIHQLRRMCATSLYHELIGEGSTIKDAEDQVSQWLGHGKNRPDVIERYVDR